MYGNNYGEHGTPRGEESEKSSLRLIYPCDSHDLVVFFPYTQSKSDLGRSTQNKLSRNRELRDVKNLPVDCAREKSS
jgi:hypothetical protein